MTLMASAIRLPRRGINKVFCTVVCTEVGVILTPLLQIARFRGKFLTSMARRAVKQIRWKRRAGGARARRRKAYRTLRGRARKSGHWGRMASKELKFFDQDIDDTLIAVNGSIFSNASAEESLCRIAQGTAEINRIGRQCTIRHISWKYRIRLNQTADITATSVTVRLILYQDKACNGAAAAITDLLETNHYQSYRNLANESRFVFLCDKLTDLVSVAGSGNGTTLDFGEVGVSAEFNKTCNIKLEFNSTVGALAELRTNNIGLLLLSSEADLVKFESTMRLRFSG